MVKKDKSELFNTPPPIPRRPIFQNQGIKTQRIACNYPSNMNFNFPPYSMTYGHPFNANSYNQYPEYYTGLGNSQSTFLRLVEESTQPAFSSIENLVSTVTSISTMLESTYQALRNSFRAIIAVINNFSQLKNNLWGIFFTSSVIRYLCRLFRRLLYTLGLIRKISTEAVWVESANDTGFNLPVSPNNWPLLMYICFIFGTPYVLWRLVQKYMSDKSCLDWAKGETDHFVAHALYDFTAQNPDEISITANQMITIAPKECQPAVKGWLLASADGNVSGIVPANYIKILGRRPGNISAKNDHCFAPDESGNNSTSKPDRMTNRNKDIELSLTE